MSKQQKIPNFTGLIKNLKKLEKKVKKTNNKKTLEFYNKTCSKILKKLEKL